MGVASPLRRPRVIPHAGPFHNRNKGLMPSHQSEMKTLAEAIASVIPEETPPGMAATALATVLGEVIAQRAPDSMKRQIVELAGAIVTKIIHRSN